MITVDTIRCITPGCGVSASRLGAEGEMFPSGPFSHDAEPPFPHDVNDPGPAAVDLPALATRVADLTEAIDQFILDSLGGF